jgi:hypothetical protein
MFGGQYREEPVVSGTDAKTASISGATSVKPRRCRKCTRKMPCVELRQYLINGFVPSGRVFTFQCDEGHVTQIQSMSRTLRWFFFAALFLWSFLTTGPSGGALHWIMGALGMLMAWLFLHAAYMRVATPEVD